MKYLMVLSAFVLSTVAHAGSKVVETPAAQKKAVAVQPVEQPAQQPVSEEEAELIVMEDEVEAALDAPVKQ